jgi:tripartite-type tricarboxylate transporter receptor subunit TctC
MKLPRRQFLHLAAGATALITLILSVSMFGNGAWSQATRTIKVVVPYAPGGAADIMARLLAEQIGRAQRVTMVIENRPGAGTAIATEAIARATPDGNTVLIIASSFVINPHLRKLSYDPLSSFEPVCYLVRSPNVVAVNSASPYRTIGDLLAAARARPGELTMGASGPGTGFQIGFEVLKRAANINMTFVPYAGSAHYWATMWCRRWSTTGPRQSSCRRASCAHSPLAHRLGSRHCRRCQPSPSPVSGTTTQSLGTGW